jgi:hypothetical protein
MRSPAGEESLGSRFALTGTTAQTPAALSNGGRMTLVGGFFFDADLSAATPAGANIALSLGSATVTFAGVSTAGTTTVSPIDPHAQGPAPEGFLISGPAFDIATTAQFTAPVTICFTLTSVADPNAFANLRVLHGEGGLLVDRTTSHDFATRQLCATVSSLSPFVVATVTTPRDSKQRALERLVALRAALSDKQEEAELEMAIESLARSLDSSL